VTNVGLITAEENKLGPIELEKTWGWGVGE
jgi:hypothetical protein